jgi:hypothetical protein
MLDLDNQSSNIINAVVNLVQHVPDDDEREREPYATSVWDLKLLVYAAITLYNLCRAMTSASASLERLLAR